MIRAVSKATNQPWDKSYVDVALQGFIMNDMPSANYVLSAYLASKGFTRKIISNSCPDCYTVQDFCVDHPKGTYILATGSHVVAVQDGDYYDSWDSGNEVPMYYWQKED